MAQENLDVFRDAWINQVRILTDAVDDITTIDDFLAVSENHILDDVNNCVAALQVRFLSFKGRSSANRIDFRHLMWTVWIAQRALFEAAPLESVESCRPKWTTMSPDITLEE